MKVHKSPRGTTINLGVMFKEEIDNISLISSSVAAILLQLW